MVAIKKIVLFLFGIVLIVFGNKAALNTIFGEEADLAKDASAKEEDASTSKAVVTENISAPMPETQQKEIVEESTPKKVESPKKEAQSEKAAVVKTPKTEEAKPKDEKPVEQKVSTTIEKESAEPASATY